MKFRYLTLALGMAGLLSACDRIPMNQPAQDTASASTAQINDTSALVASVNGTRITEAMLDLYMAQREGRRPGDPSANDRNAVLEEVVSLELARQQGEKDGVDKQLDVALLVEQQRRAVIATAAIKKQLEANPVSEADLRKIYDENIGGGDEYKARHILVKEQEEARKLITELDKGADFSELAKQHSTGPSGKNGGELGWFSAKQMVKPFSDAVATMEKGSYTKEPVETQFGWHIIMLDDSRESTPPDFEMLKPQIASMVQNQRVQEFIAKLRESASIEIVAQAGAAADTNADTGSDASAGTEESGGDSAAADAAPATE